MDSWQTPVSGTKYSRTATLRTMALSLEIIQLENDEPRWIVTKGHDDYINTMNLMYTSAVKCLIMDTHNHLSGRADNGWPSVVKQFKSLRSKPKVGDPNYLTSLVGATHLTTIPFQKDDVQLCFCTRKKVKCKSNLWTFICVWFRWSDNSMTFKMCAPSGVQGDMTDILDSEHFRCVSGNLFA